MSAGPHGETGFASGESVRNSICHGTPHHVGLLLSRNDAFERHVNSSGGEVDLTTQPATLLRDGTSDLRHDAGVGQRQDGFCLATLTQLREGVPRGEATLRELGDGWNRAQRDVEERKL